MNKILWMVVTVIVIGGIWYAYSEQNSSPEVSPTATPTQQTGVKTYVSNKLGLQFDYDANPEEGVTVGVKESGNKIYVYVNNTDPENGQFVEVFSKNTNETFKDSIRRQILTQYPSPDCKIEVTPSNIKGGYQVAEISYPKSDNPDDPWFSNFNLCNPNYDQTNGIRYFLYNPRYPDKFVFLSIGQYAIPAHGQIPWQDTLSFTD